MMLVIKNRKKDRREKAGQKGRWGVGYHIKYPICQHSPLMARQSLESPQGSNC